MEQLRTRLCQSAPKSCIKSVELSVQREAAPSTSEIPMKTQLFKIIAVAILATGGSRDFAYS